MSLEIDISEPHDAMLTELRDAHGGDIDQHLRHILEAEIHESYQELRVEGVPS